MGCPSPWQPPSNAVVPAKGTVQGPLGEGVGGHTFPFPNNWGLVMRFVVAGVVTAVALALLVGVDPFEAVAGGKMGDKAEHTIAEVMKLARKTALLQKVDGGNAAKGERKER